MDLPSQPELFLVESTDDFDLDKFRASVIKSILNNRGIDYNWRKEFADLIGSQGLASVAACDKIEELRTHDLTNDEPTSYIEVAILINKLSRKENERLTKLKIRRNREFHT